jgi:hypothetical protein
LKRLQKSKGSNEPGQDKVDEEEEEEEEEEYVILDLDNVFHGQPVPANTYYVLSVSMGCIPTCLVFDLHSGF